MTLEIVLVLLLIVLNGVFVLSEMALISVRRARLKTKAEEGDPGAAAALEIASNPNLFLSTAQVGITLIGMLTAVFAGARITDEVSAFLDQIPLLHNYSSQISFAVVVVMMTLLSLIIGELVPKRLALVYGEQVAIRVARPMRAVSELASPLVWFLSTLTDLVLKLFRVPAVVERPVTEEEFRVLLDEGHEAGVFEDVEKQIVSSALGIGDARVKSIMTPREDVVWLNTDDSLDVLWTKILTSGHTYLPVCEGSFDNILGLVSIKDFLGKQPEGLAQNLMKFMRKPIFVPDTVTATQLLAEFKRSGQHIALVVDEHGTFEGLITMIDILQEIVGSIESVDEETDPSVVVREDGSWLIDGRYSLNNLIELTGLENLPDGANRIYHSLAGFIMDVVGGVPRTGARFDYDGLRFEVIDMDGRRVDRVLVQKLP